MRRLNIILGESRWKNPRNISSLSGTALILGALVFLYALALGVLVGSNWWIGLFITFSIGLLHFWVTYTTSSVPITVSILLFPLTVPLFWIHELLGIIVNFSVLVISLHFLFSELSLIRIIAPGIYLSGTLIHLGLTSTPLVSPDTFKYYSRIEEFGTISLYIAHLLDLAQKNVLALQSSIQIFPSFYLPIYKGYGFESPTLIILVNTTLWLTSVIIFRELIISHLQDFIDIPANTVFIILLISPTAMYWSSTFLKDITVVFLCMLATYLFFRKRFLLFIAAVLFATSIRIYSVAIISIYIATIMWSPLLLSIGLLGSTTFVLAYTGNIVTLFNSILVVGYFFISPNPMDLENWLIPELVPRLIEGVLYAGGLVISGIYAMVEGDLRNQYLILTAGLLIYALIMVAVGYRWTVFTQGLPYGFGTAGENILRKMLPMMPLIAIWMAQTLSYTNLTKIDVK